jgi:hypothetical protein
MPLTFCYWTDQVLLGRRAPVGGPDDATEPVRRSPRGPVTRMDNPPFPRSIAPYIDEGAEIGLKTQPVKTLGGERALSTRWRKTEIERREAEVSPNPSIR